MMSVDARKVKCYACGGDLQWNPFGGFYHCKDCLTHQRFEAGKLVPISNFFYMGPEKRFQVCVFCRREGL